MRHLWEDLCHSGAGVPYWQEQKGKRLQYPLAESVPVVFSVAMMHVNPESISAAIRSAPAFARLGLSMRDATMRDRAADALAVAIVEDLERARPDHDGNQMTLPL